MIRVPSSERGFAVAAVLLCVSFAIAAVGSGAAPASATDFEPDVPEEYRFNPPTADGTATVDGTSYDTLAAALTAAEPGATVHLEGRFRGPITVDTPNVTLAGAGPARTVVAGTETGDVVTIAAPNVTLDDLWVRDGGYDTESNDAGIWVDAPGATVRHSRITDATFGIWLDSAVDARVTDNTIVGRESVTSLTERGNGIQVYEATDAYIADNRITDTRDGIYYSWASGVVAENNTMWDLRYGVHYMYSDDNRLVGNIAFDNDAGYALMISQRLTVVDNVAVNNTLRSGHGIFVKSIDDSRIANNTLEENENGLFVYNSLNNTIASNDVRENDVGVHLTAGSVREHVERNSFVGNGQHVKAVIGEQVAWNGSVGNYWSGASTADLDGDGISEVRYQPAGIVERLTATKPTTRIFAKSPAFDGIRRAEATVPLVESPGVVDYRPLTDPPTNRSESP